VAPAHVERARWVLHGFPVCSGARAIGEAETGPAGLVTARSGFDTLRVLDVPSGEQLPRTC
jgi:hydrogenase maturation factor